MGINQTISTPPNVEVWTEKSERDRHQISARLTIPHVPEQVWQVLTHLASESVIFSIS